MQSCKKTSPKPPKSCRITPQIPPQSKLQDLVNDYKERWGNSYKEEDKWWGDQTESWEKAIEKAWKSRFANGKMHSHQYRVANKLPKGLEIALNDNRQPKEFNKFDLIYVWVKSISDHVHGLGPTTTYDVARRLGVWLSLYPDRIYLHAGTAVGAKKIGIRGATASLSAFPKEIQQLGATHAENFLCIYKSEISCDMIEP